MPAVLRILGQPNHTAVVLRTQKAIPFALITTCYVRHPLPMGHDLWVLHNTEQPNGSTCDQLMTMRVNCMVYGERDVSNAFGKNYSAWWHHVPGIALLLHSAPAYQYIWAIED